MIRRPAVVIAGYGAGLIAAGLAEPGLSRVMVLGGMALTLIGIVLMTAEIRLPGLTPRAPLPYVARSPEEERYGPAFVGLAFAALTAVSPVAIGLLLAVAILGTCAVLCLRQPTLTPPQ